MTLLRAIAETYLSFRYASIEPRTEEEIEFRDALLDYHGTCKHLHAVERLKTQGATLDHAHARKANAWAKLQANPTFAAQPKNVQKKQRDGETFHRGLRDIAADAKINADVWTGLYFYMSQFEHSAPYAVKLLPTLGANGPDGPRALAWVTQYAACFLSKFTLDMTNLFPGSIRLLDAEKLLLIHRHAEALESARQSQLPAPGEAPV